MIDKGVETKVMFLTTSVGKCYRDVPLGISYNKAQEIVVDMVYNMVRVGFARFDGNIDSLIDKDFAYSANGNQYIDGNKMSYTDWILILTGKPIIFLRR